MEIKSAISIVVVKKNKDSSPLFLFPAQEPLIKAANRLSNPLINDDGRVYVCLEKNLIAFESNGTIAWKLPLGYTCDVGIAPVHGGVKTVRAWFHFSVQI